MNSALDCHCLSLQIGLRNLRGSTGSLNVLDCFLLKECYLINTCVLLHLENNKKNTVTWHSLVIYMLQLLTFN